MSLSGFRSTDLGGGIERVPQTRSHSRVLLDGRSEEAKGRRRCSKPRKRELVVS